MNAIPGVTRHARERMIEHHGFDPTHDEWLRVLFSILDRTATLISGTDGYGGERWAVEIRGQVLKIIWKPDDATIVTVLPDGTSSLNPSNVRRMFEGTRRRRAGQRPGRIWRDDLEAAE